MTLLALFFGTVAVHSLSQRARQNAPMQCKPLKRLSMQIPGTDVFCIPTNTATFRAL